MLELFGLKKTKSQVVKPGDVFGRLEVLDTGIRDGRRYYAICQCSCGSELRSVRFDSLVNGVTLACGCLQKEKATTHGLHKSPHYSRWRLMIDRCINPNSSAYHNYGARGIKVCERWLSIKSFIEDLPPGYFDGAEMDRIDNDGNYEPGNIRWATESENADNKRSRRDITFNGKTQSLTRWAEETGIEVSMIWDRLSKLNWSVERALTEHPMPMVDVVKRASAVRWSEHTKKEVVRKTDRKHRIVNFKGKDITLPELSNETGISVKLLYKRIFERKWDIEKATST